MKRVFVLSLAGMLIACSVGFAQRINHPLDPLNWQEYWTVLEVLQREGHLDSKTRFSMVNLDQPPKEAVLKWTEGQPIPRQAYALVRQGRDTYEALVNLVDSTLVKWTKTEGIQPNWLGEEFSKMVDKVKEHPDFVEAMKKRGYDDLTLIDCMTIPPGYYGTPEEQGRRIGHVGCVDPRGIRNNWTRGIENLTAIVDLDDEEIIRIVDEGVVPVPTVSADYDQASIGAPREVPGPIRIEQPLGPGFKPTGNHVEWQNWRFHVRPDQRVGMILSMVNYVEKGQSRSVLYEGYLSEMFVPYMDPSTSWYVRNFLDAGEFSEGGLAKPLLRGLDCPDSAVYMDQLVSNDLGRPVTVPDTICLFERYSGDMAWRHWANEPESRPKRDLVVRSAAVLGNYDYVFDWVFQQDGSIRVSVGATGIAETRMVAEQQAVPDSNIVGTTDRDLTETPAPDAFGRFVDPNIVAVNHDHYFSFRLDLDVDGRNNSLLMDRLRTQELPADHPRRSIWVRKPMIAKTESDAKININLEKPALWRVISHDRRNHVGYETSYQLMPVKTGRTLLTEEDYPRRRAGFIDYHLWATPFRLSERYAAGDHPTLSEPGQGLPAWTEENRSIEKTDLVLWYTVGMHHLVRAEDWPVMPVLWHTFELRPFDFFDRNPAMDLPRKP
ncbi:MAG: hypothetical protein JSU96_06805 [Acidobacteriota bacterium]|nr:MAG: hypothetical protein JSU96_06805 [Acidobacteriota bacterium]